jgi:hypothetical protein
MQPVKRSIDTFPQGKHEKETAESQDEQSEKRRKKRITLIKS